MLQTILNGYYETTNSKNTNNKSKYLNLIGK